MESLKDSIWNYLISAVNGFVYSTSWGESLWTCWQHPLDDKSLKKTTQLKTYCCQNTCGWGHLAKLALYCHAVSFGNWYLNLYSNVLKTLITSLQMILRVFDSVVSKNMMPNRINFYAMIDFLFNIAAICTSIFHI